jgi:Fur family zinc uptake transcriptional regulator
MTRQAGAASRPFPKSGHDHAGCVRRALEAATDLCARRGAKLTDIRKRVLELVWESHAPAGAYAILEKLSAEGHNPAPPTVYRALDFLLAHGLTHRIESRNAYVGCPHPGHELAGPILICSGCGSAAEIEGAAIEQAVRDGAAKLGFLPRSSTIEIEGLCPSCQKSAHG